MDSQLCYSLYVIRIVSISYNMNFLFMNLLSVVLRISTWWSFMIEFLIYKILNICDSDINFSTVMK